MATDMAMGMATPTRASSPRFHRQTVILSGVA